ncbi:FAD binding domain-containing protein [Phycomyces nitens]|nr:FAD binding domain-containing protein [Phycomyces nitens]
MTITDKPTPLPSKVDFLIVGGGPVGLLSANLIVQAGFTVRILDIEAEPNHWGRGDWIHGRTLELLEQAGLADELLKTGVKVEKMATYMNGTIQSTMPFVPDQVESKHQYLLCVGQHITESSLQSILSLNDVQVERPSTVVKIEKCPGSVYPIKATVMNMQGETSTEEIECKYLLGCDGAHSDIRQQLGIANEGETTETHAGVLDALVRTNFTGRRDVCILQSDHAKTISLFPRENGLTRIFVHFNENEHDLRKEQHNRNKIQLEDIQREAKRALLPHRIEFLGILYWTVYVVGQRQAATMDSHDNRVFLCGDAAHSQSPTLGQGVNTGFGDVFNLIWKLCLVERGQIKPEVLSTYTAERHPIASKVLSIDKTAAKAAAGHKSEDYCMAVQENRSFTTGFGIQYTNLVNTDPLVWNSDCENGRYVMQAGMRAPHYKVVQFSSGRKVRLFEAHTESTPDWLSFTILVLANDLKKTSEEIKPFLSWHNNHQTSLTTRLMVITTSTADTVGAYDLGIQPELIMLDKLNRAQCHTGYHQKTELQDNSDDIVVSIVRPDGYIGTLLRGTSGEALGKLAQAYFDRFCVLH